nr:chorismate mutase [Streptomyces sp. SID8354]
MRARVDVLDEQIVELLAARTAVVRRIGALKGAQRRSEEEVRSPQRVERVVARVRSLADSHGMDPNIAERTYRALIAALTDMQLQALGHQP